VQTDGGALQFVGRADDVIKVAGENVSLTEVEAILAQAPGVLEVAVVPRPDEIRDVVPVAYIVARDQADPAGRRRPRGVGRPAAGAPGTAS
jgi:carnitine-CoA ligase